MNLPRDLWPAPGSWGLGVPPDERRSLEVRPEDELFPEVKRTPTQKKARPKPRASLLRRVKSRVRGKDPR